ncbi:response regulator [Azospira restricta]|uniref:Response regulator n=1 Tax=Azospira restricta TaxID=404405 RepID=A0A974SP40_9RHOO|nr:response regulator [Azospira restricta]QRJ63834.1 response regulator [Azospira restricta]
MEEVLRRVLVVDHSRVVRSALAKHLREHFEVREEADGESAWQTLVLDSTIIAVVSGAQLPRLNGYDLLARLRVNKLRRLCDIPFLLVISGHESDSDRQRAREHGVTDFITRGMPRQEIVARIGRLVNWELATHFPGLTEMPPRDKAGEAPARRAPDVLAADAVAGRLAQAIAQTPAAADMIGVLAFGLDLHGGLVARFGNETADAVATHVARVLQTKIGHGDCIGHGDAGDCLIVSPGTSLAGCTAFAQRVCRGLANSQVNIAGEAFPLQVSAGIASLSADAGLDAPALIARATLRLRMAQSAGGNRVHANDPAAAPGGFGPEYFEELFNLYDPQAAARQFGSLGLHLMPLLRTLDREFRFGLPLSEIERSFAVRASEERDRRP